MSGWLITGAGGMLGQEMVARLKNRGEEVASFARSDLDITDAVAINTIFRQCGPEVVVNCAAWTAVDDAELNEDAAFLLNGQAVGIMAEYCASNNITLVQISTDYVFDGSATQPYSEEEIPSPRTVYGRSKLAGERQVLDRLSQWDGGYVVRTAWLYGAHGPNFVRTMIRLAHERRFVDVVTDQHGQPTWAADVVSQVVRMVRSGAPAGIYHATSSGETTWFEFAQEIFRLLGKDPARVKRTTSSKYHRPAPRPSHSVLGHAAWKSVGIAPIGNWQTALHCAFPELLEATVTDLRSVGPPT